MNKRHIHAELIHAWAEGAEIEVKTPSGWKDVPDPSWIPTIKYRINPRTVRREGWVKIVKNPHGQPLAISSSVFVKLVKDLNAVKDLLMAMKAAEEE